MSVQAKTTPVEGADDAQPVNGSAVEPAALNRQIDNISTNGTNRSGLQAAYQPIATDLQRVESLLGEVFQHEHPFIDDLLKHGSLLGGKRIRPALLLLAAKACGKVNDHHIVLATAIEMIHTASLVHDDVLDEAETRRHVPTIHRKWNQESSVLFGDYLFTQAFSLVGERVGGTACGRIARVTNKVCEGELRQIASRGQFELSVDEYTKIIDSKTAALCEIATRLGAEFALDAESDDSATIVESFAEYGRLLGLAFQIADDVIDLDGDESLTGKSLGRDLEMSKATLPLILALQNAQPEERQEFLSRLVDGSLEAEEVRTWVNGHGGIDAARKQARAYADQAAALVEKHASDSDAAKVLKRLCQFVIERRY